MYVYKLMYWQHSFMNICETCFHVCIYIDLGTSNTLLQIFMKTYTICLYI